MDTIQKMVPYLTKDEESKCVALLAITTLARPEVATQMATLYRGNGSVCALQKIAAAGDLQAKQQAVSALSSIATSSQGEDRNSALGALSGIFEKYKAGVVKVTASTDSGEMMSSGLVVSSSGFVLIPEYMAGISFGGSAMPKPHGFSVELWDGTKHQAILVDVNESYRLAILKVDYPALYPIVLSRKPPAASTTVIVVGFFQGTLLKAEIARVVSLDQHFVSVEPAGRYPGQETGGIGGGPILDDKGEAVGISHSSKSSLELFVRSDLAINYLHSKGYM